MQAKKLFTPEEQEEIRRAITQAELNTSGEVVPVIASASGRYDRAEDLFGLLLAILAVSLVWTLFQGVNPNPIGWSSGSAVSLGLPTLLGVFVGFFFLGAILATWLPALKLPFVSKSEMATEVERRAAESFFRFGIGKTRNATGILIYISLFEHQVVIKGDSAISEKLEQDDWNRVRDAVISGLKNGQATSGLIEGIQSAGQLLEKAFPASSDNPDELPNEIHLI